jgi:hypothetical protein
MNKHPDAWTVAEYARAKEETAEMGLVSEIRLNRQENTMNAKITPASLNLFLSLAEDAPNWSGTPLVEVSEAEKGNLTQLKRAGLIRTMEDRGDIFATFTDAGKALAAEHNLTVED